MLFARKMVAPIRLCRAKQGHLGRRCWQGGPPGMLPGPAWGHGGSEAASACDSGGASCCSPVPGSRGVPRDGCCHGGCRMNPAVGEAPGKSHRDGQGTPFMAAGAGAGDVSHRSSVASPSPCCFVPSAQGSAQAVPGALPMPQAKPAAFTFSCPGYFRFETLPSRERCFPQLFPFLILHLLLKPSSSPPPSTPDTVQMKRPQLTASETSNNRTAGLPFLPKRGKSIPGSRMLEDRGRSQAQAPTEHPTPGTGSPGHPPPRCPGQEASTSAPRQFVSYRTLPSIQPPAN